MSIIILFINAGVIFEGAFSLWVFLIHFALFLQKNNFLFFSILFNLNSWLIFWFSPILLLQIIKRTNVFYKIYILGFLNLSYLPQRTQQIFFILKIYGKYCIILSFTLYLFGENKLVYSNKLLSFNDCILKIFVAISLLPINFGISFGICSTLKLPQYIKLWPFTCKATQWVPIDLYSSRLITYAPSFILGKLFLE